VGKTALQVREVITGESRLASVDLRGLLDAGETLSGTPTVEEVDTADLSFSGETANGVALTINGVTVAINHAVQFVVNAANAVAGEHYLVEVTCSTSASQTVKGYLRIHCVV
jgi:hypothetical protein